MASTTLRNLFENQLQDAYSSETQIKKALPKLAKAAASAELKAGFEQHLTETNGQIGRLENIGQALGIKLSGNTCEATEGLVEEGEEIIKMDLDPDARDAGLIAAAQKVEHYEIAMYGSLCAWAKQLGLGDTASTLHQTLEEEKRTDAKLTQIAEAKVNARASAK